MDFSVILLLPNGVNVGKHKSVINWVLQEDPDIFINNVYWLANFDSNRTNYDDWVTITYDINELKFNKFDYIFVCNSPNFSNSLSEAAFSALINIVMHTKKCKKFDFFRPNLANHITKGIITNE